jgi:hypothetical protein
MKTWRLLGLFCASLSLGLVSCGDSHKDPTESSPKPVSGGDAGLDSGEDPEDVDTGTEVDVDTGSPDSTQSEAGLDSCEPLGCREQGFNCGTPDDKCGGPLNCGDTCKGSETCGGGGKPFVCGCTAATCESLSSERGAKVCGMVADGCGGTLSCGDGCTGTDTCGGGPAANQCGCSPNPDPCGSKSCGSASDGCGHTVQCGASAGACSANKECNASQACLCKTDTTAFCAGKCGTLQTPDGCQATCVTCQTFCAAGEGVACGASCECPAPGTCRSTGTCCVPETTASLCGTAQCGTRVNRCGQTVQCGTACTGGQVCSSEAKCESPAVAALIGKYAARSTGFGVAQGLATRAEGLLLVDIYRDNAGKLTMREQSCWSGAFQKKSGCAAGTNCELTVTEVSPTISARAIPTNIELNLAPPSDLNGSKDWLRPVQPLDQNTSGWRRGRPSYCPANGGPPDSTLPGFAPANDTRALGASKPWLAPGTLCKCPAEEFALPNRAPCSGLTGEKLTTCMSDPARYSLPYSVGNTAAPSTVTDCRVVDDDLDQLPGNTADIKATLVITLMAKIGSASVTANRFWGTADTSGAKRHWGVSQDQQELQSANVWCEGSSLLCGTGSGDLCPGYRSQPYDKDHRLNPLDFVPLNDKTPPTGGWANPGQSVEASCAEIYARRNDAGWFAPVVWSTRYPDPSECTL